MLLQEIPPDKPLPLCRALHKNAKGNKMHFAGKHPSLAEAVDRVCLISRQRALRLKAVFRERLPVYILRKGRLDCPATETPDTSREMGAPPEMPVAFFLAGPV